jgi:hypothetical protein
MITRQWPSVMAWGLMVGVSAGAGCGEGDRRLAPIQLDSMLTIGATQGEGVMMSWPRVSPRLPNGTRILVPQPGGVSALPTVLGDDGKYLGTIGAEGDEAGEFRGALFARVGPGDSVYIFAENPRAVVFSADRRPGRTIPLPMGIWDALVLPDQRIVLTSPMNERPLPFLLLDSQGKLLQELGGSDSASLAVKSPRWLARGNDGSYWTMPMQFRWRLEHWDSTGALIKAIDRNPAWFPHYQQMLALTHTQPPQPTVQAFWVDSAGRLWVLGRTGDPTWAKGLGPVRAGVTGAVAPILDPDKVYDTVIELRDAATGELISQTRFDVSYPFMVEPGVVMRVLDTPEGWKRAELMRVVAAPPPRPRLISRSSNETASFLLEH